MFRAHFGTYSKQFFPVQVIALHFLGTDLAHESEGYKPKRTSTTLASLSLIQ
jgi:hypothetical protein